MEGDSHMDGSTVPRVHPDATRSDPARPRTPRFRRALQVGVAIGVASGVGVGAAALASAATSTTTPSGSSTPKPTVPKTPPPPGHFRGHGPGGFGFGGRGFEGDGLGGLGPVVHGEATVKGPNGYETVEFQSGTVTSVTDVSGSTWSIVITSSDKTALTYTVGSGTSVNGGETGISAVKKGDNVSIVAVVSKGTATAKSLRDVTRLKANGSSWMPQAPGPSTGSWGPASAGTSTN